MASWLVVVARRLYLARHLFTLYIYSVMKTFYTADGDRDTKDSLLKFVAQVRIGVMHCVHNFLCPNSSG